MADTLEVILRHPHLEASAIASRRKSFSIFAKITKRELSDIPETIEEVQAAIEAVGEAPGYTKRTLATVFSHIRTSLKLCGADYTSGRAVWKLLPSWAALFDRLQQVDVPQIGKIRLNPMAAVMSQLGIEPHQVAQEHVPILWLRVGEFYPKGDAHEKARVAIKCWNRFGRLFPEFWPQTALTAVTKLDRDTLPAERFSEPFRRSVEVIQRNAASPLGGKVDPQPPVSVRQAEKFSEVMFELASAYCRQRNINPESIETCFELLTPEALDVALSYWNRRFGGIRSAANLHRARTVLRLALRHNEVSPGDVAKFKTIVDNVDPGTTLSSKRRCRLREFWRRDVQAAYFLGPEKVMDRLRCEQVIRLRHALAAQRACAWSLCQAVMLVPGELASIRVDPGFISGALSEMKLVIEDVDHRDVYAIPNRIGNIVREFVERYLPVINPEASHLFAGRSGGQRQAADFAKVLAKFIETEMAEFNCSIKAEDLPYISCMLYLLSCPDDFETPRRLLRHIHLSSVEEFFDFLGADAKKRRYQEINRDSRWWAGRNM